MRYRLTIGTTAAVLALMIAGTGTASAQLVAQDLRRRPAGGRHAALGERDDRRAAPQAGVGQPGDDLVQAA